MRVNLKLAAFCLSAIVITGCGNDSASKKNSEVNDMSNSEAKPDREQTSPAPALIFDESVNQKAAEFLTPAVKSVINDFEAGKLTTEQALKSLETLSKKTNSPKEKAYLSLKIGTFRAMVDIWKDKARMTEDAFIQTRVPALFSYFALRNNEIVSFVDSYVQSPQLKEALTKYIKAENDILVRMTFDGEPFEGSLKEKALKETKKVALDEIRAHFQSDKSELLFLEKLKLLPFGVSEMVKASSALASALSAGTPDLSGRVSLRGARVGVASVDFSQLMVNGAAGSVAHISLPMYVQLKGSVEGSKDIQDLTGVAVYKVDNTLVGIIHGYAITSNNPDSTLDHNETSAVISRSFGKAYLEGQAGFVNSTLNHNAVNGERYQGSAGYDCDIITPFVQASVRNLNNVSEHAAYVGCELDVMNVGTDSYTLSGRLTVKGGYHSFKGTIGSVEGSGVIQLNNGLKLDAALNLAGGGESTARIGFSIDQ